MIKHIFIYIILISLSFCAVFKKGMCTAGGNVGYFKDFNANVTIMHISPSFGYFINDNILLEAGFTRININNDNYVPNSYSGLFIHGDQSTHSFGARLFLGKAYLGYEFVQGLELSMTTGLGDSFINGYTKFDGNAERGLIKVGYLTPFSQNLYLDVAYHYLFILDEDIREQAIELAEVGSLNLGVSYFWFPNKK